MSCVSTLHKGRVRRLGLVGVKMNEHEPLTVEALRRLGIEIPPDVKSSSALVQPEVKVHTSFRYGGYGTRLTVTWEVEKVN